MVFAASDTAQKTSAPSRPESTLAGAGRYREIQVAILPSIMFIKCPHITDKYLSLPPYHLIAHTGVALGDLHDLGGDVFFHVVRHGNAIVTVAVHFHSGIYRLE